MFSFLRKLLGRTPPPPGKADLAARARAKAEELTALVTSDPRWDLNDETMCIVFGFSMYGYVFGVGRTVCFMDVPEINTIAVEQLTKVGVGAKYSQGLVDEACRIFSNQCDHPTYCKLAEIGHSHFASKDLKPLVDSIFENTQTIHGSAKPTA